MLDSSLRDRDCFRQRLDQHAGVDELARPQPVVIVVERRLQRDRTGGRVDRVVRREQSALGNDLAVVSAGYLDDHGTLRPRRLHAREIAFGQGEHNGDRLVLGNRDDVRLVRDFDQIADIELVEADTTIDRRADDTIAKIDLRSLDHGVVGSDRRGLLVNRRLLIVYLLNRREIALREGLIPLQVEGCTLHLRSVLIPLGHRLIKGCLIGTRINLGDDVAFVDLLPLVCRQRDERPVHLRADLHHVERLHSAEPLQVNRHVLLLCFRSRHGDKLLRGRSGRTHLGRPADHPPPGKNAKKQNEDCDPETTS